MLTLTIGRDSFKICHKEGARTTVWDVSKNDSEESLIQTFRDVIAFVRSSELRADYSGPNGEELRVGVDPAGDGVAIVQSPTNGWAAAYGPPALPERLQGEVELIQPGEDA